jgi:hypothetical protein
MHRSIFVNGFSSSNVAKHLAEVRTRISNDIFSAKVRRRKVFGPATRERNEELPLRSLLTLIHVFFIDRIHFSAPLRACGLEGGNFLA